MRKVYLPQLNHVMDVVQELDDAHYAWKKHNDCYESVTIREHGIGVYNRFVDATKGIKRDIEGVEEHVSNIITDFIDDAVVDAGTREFKDIDYDAYNPEEYIAIHVSNRAEECGCQGMPCPVCKPGLLALVR